MFMQPLSNDQIAAASTAKNANNDPQEAQDRFLKLMVAQLNNQDPLNPVDNAQMTSQMAQINTVSGITQLNATLKSMADQFNSMQSLQSTSLIGKQAVVNGGTLSFNGDGTVAKGGLLLPEDADKVSVQILGKAGNLIDTIELGTRPAGQYWFDWDNTTGVDPETVGAFKVTASKGDQVVAASPLSTLKVDSVGLVDGAVRLRTEDGQAFAYGDVLAFR